MLVELNKIHIKSNRRPVNDTSVATLVRSIQEVGLLQPIVIDQDNNLVAGRHRIEAYKTLNIDSIECIVINAEKLILELAEIDENLVRNELTPGQLAVVTLRRKEIYEELYPESKKGKSLNPNKISNLNNSSISADSALIEEKSFVTDTSEKTGQSTRVISENVQIGKNIPDGILETTDANKTTLLNVAKKVAKEKKAVKEELKDKLDTEEINKEIERRADIKAKELLELDKKERIKKREDKLKRAKDNYIVSLEKNKDSDNKTDIYTTDKKYRIVYADPPWSYNDKCVGGGVQDGGVQSRHYNTMPLTDICSIPIKDITDDNAVLFIWVTSPLLESSFKVIKSWGFKYKSSFIWDKIKHNMGHYNSVRHELLLVCTKGSCTPDKKKLYDSVLSIEKSKHSKKPLEFLNIIDDLYEYGNRIELFARENNDPIWDVWGNEV